MMEEVHSTLAPRALHSETDEQTSKLEYDNYDEYLAEAVNRGISDINAGRYATSIEAAFALAGH